MNTLLRFWREFPYRRNLFRVLTPHNCNHGARQGYTGDFHFDMVGAHCRHCGLTVSRPTAETLARFRLHQ